MTLRSGEFRRTTREVDVSVSITLDGQGEARVDTGIGFLDHLLTTLAFHGRFDLTVTARGDLVVDDHHTAEDTALAIGTAIDRALGARSGVARFASAYAPLDESLARAVVDLSARPFAAVSLNLTRDAIGALACENIVHLFRSLAIAARLTLHLDVVRGENDHHKAEAAMKAFALAMREAVRLTAAAGVPSTKGML